MVLPAGTGKLWACVASITIDRGRGLLLHVRSACRHEALWAPFPVLFAMPPACRLIVDVGKFCAQGAQDNAMPYGKIGVKLHPGALEPLR